MTFANKLSLTLATLVLAAFLGSSVSLTARETKSLRIGTSWVVEMQGNPSTGYKWRLDPAGSENPSIVKVEDLGYGEAKGKLLGAPTPQRFRLTGLSAGFAKLHFEYVQPWVGKPAKTGYLGARRITPGKEKKMKSLSMKFVSLALAVPILATQAMAGDAQSPLPGSQSAVAANTAQCDPPCVAPEICCKLSGLEAACVDPKDCFAGDDKSKLQRK